MCPDCGHVQVPQRSPGGTPALRTDIQPIQPQQQVHASMSTSTACISVEDPSDPHSEAMRTREEAERRAQEVAQTYRETSGDRNPKSKTGPRLVSLIFALSVGFIYWITIGSYIWTISRASASTTQYGLVSTFIILPCMVGCVYRFLAFILVRLF